MKAIEPFNPVAYSGMSFEEVLINYNHEMNRIIRDINEALALLEDK